MRGLSYLICSLWSCVIRIQSSASFFLFLFTYLSQHKYILRKIEDIKNKVKWEICIISDKLGYKIGSFSVSLCVSPYLFPSISLSVSPPLSLCLPFSLFFSVSLSLSLCLSPYLCLTTGRRVQSTSWPWLILISHCTGFLSALLIRVKQ